ncbi:MAG TPA: FtsX-like permease family protein [Thermoanaerobaculia bacterium]|nr:FtsX-like permease family protein [Thermoanaerobaculia bacterium]
MSRAGGVGLAWLVAWRFLRGPRSRLLGGTARAALAATALGVTAMVVAMALMTGYREDLERKLIEGNAPIVVSPLAPGATLGATAQAQLAALPGVASVGRVAYGQGTLTAIEPAAAAEPVEVTLRGVDPGGGQLSAAAEELTPGADGLPGAVLGDELARRLGVEAGDRVRLVALGFDGDRPRFRFQGLRVGGTFDSGFAEFDASWLLLDRELVGRLMGEGVQADLYEIGLDDAGDTGTAAAAITRALGPEWMVTDWRQLNAELFAALRLQQVALFGVLGLIVLVSTFNVASTLVVLVRERMRDVGVLAALGFAPRRLWTVFLLYGGALGAAGTALGVAIGAGAAWTLTTFELIRFDPEVANIYFISSVPFRVEAADLAAVVGFALGVTLLACLAPAFRAARVDPADALRYE